MFDHFSVPDSVLLIGNAYCILLLNKPTVRNLLIGLYGSVTSSVRFLGEGPRLNCFFRRFSVLVTTIERKIPK